MMLFGRLELYILYKLYEGLHTKSCSSQLSLQMLIGRANSFLIIVLLNINAVQCIPVKLYAIAV